MKKRRLLTLAAGSVVLMAVALLQDRMVAYFGSIGLEERNAGVLAAGVSASVIGFGFLGFAGSVLTVLRITARERVWDPMVQVLGPVAAEHGQSAWVDAQRGIGFSAQRDGQRIEVQLSPDARTLTLRSTAPARQTLAWVGDHVPEESPWDAWREVGQGYRWHLRAELPAIAKALLADMPLTADLDRFFEFAADGRLVHDRSGLRMTCGAAPLDRLERQVRRGIELFSRIRRVNG